MRKKIFFPVFILISASLWSQNYRIADSEVSVHGTPAFAVTKPYIVERNYPLDTKTVFTQSELESYIEDYKKSLKSSRFFEDVQISYEAVMKSADEEPQDDNQDDAVEIIIKISLTDSKHFLAMPYATFGGDSNGSTITPKVKAKDTNFLGSMNPLSVDFDIEITKKESDDYWKFTPGLNLSYDHPFKAGIFDFTWVNDYGLSYTVGEHSPQWDAKTGLEIALPLDNLSLILEMYQYFFRDSDYADYGDELYFKEDVRFSTPLSVASLPNYSSVIYTPSLSFTLNWDADGISPENDSLFGPEIKLAHSIENSKITWENNFRTGYHAIIESDFSYNPQRNDFYPSLSAEAKFFTNFTLAQRDWFDIIGICADLYAFTYFDIPGNDYFYGKKIGDRLRGIADESYFGNIRPDYTTSSAIVLNLDLPMNIVRTNFSKDLINFNMQLAPFFDVAVYRDRQKKNQVESALCSGFEVLVYPKKWSSFIIRGSIGFDLKGVMSYDGNLAKGLWRNKEISIGLGLLY